MITRRIISEQVSRIINGGATTSESKIKLSEIGNLVDHERDALIKKVIMESSMLGEHEIPNEFISKERILCERKEDTPTGEMGRLIGQFNKSPIYLPNDGSIYQVCQSWHERKAGAGQPMHDKRRITINDIGHSSNPTNSYVRIPFSSKNGTKPVGNKFKFTFKHGHDANSMHNYSFTFSYKNNSGVGREDNLTYRNINPQILLQSLDSNSDFQDFLKANRLGFEYFEAISSESNSVIVFRSTFNSQYWGASGSTPFDIISTLTNESVVNWDVVNDLSGATGLYVQDFALSTIDAVPYPSVSFGIRIDYSKNKYIKDLHEDIFGIKEKGSCVLNTVVELTQDDISQAGQQNDPGSGYGSISGADLCKIWLNKYQGPLRMYGINCEYNFDNSDGGAGILISEEQSLGGFDHIYFQDFGSVIANVTHAMYTYGGSDYTYKSNLAKHVNTSDSECYHRMPNAGLRSRLYDNTILLTGKIYWYRESNSIMIYNSNESSFGATSLYIDVWYVADSKGYEDDDPLPMPSEYVPIVVKNLVQTFTMMRAAKEDVVNDNTDII